MYDLIIENGMIIDGTGRKGFVGDIGVKDERIIKIGNLKDKESKKIINAKGLVVSPGFIDIHSHSDWNIFKMLHSQNVIRQGITTEVTGQCGDSAFPVMNENAYEVYDYYSDKMEKGDKPDWITTNDFFEKAIKTGLSGNIASLVGHGTIRLNIMGYENRKATEEEMDKMKELMEQVMKDGAFGISSGLPYAPGCYGDLKEVTELCKIVAKHNGIYATHMKTTGKELTEVIKDTINVGEKTGVKVDISHLKAGGRENWGKSSECIKVIDDARNRGVKVIYDFYPYNGAANPLMDMFPKWLFEGGGKGKFIEGLSTSSIREKVRLEMPFESDEYWDIIILGDIGSEKNKHLRGKSLREVSRILRKNSFDVACDLLIEEDCDVNVIVMAMCEEDTKTFASYKFAAVGADARVISSVDYKGHPRAFGTFPTFLGKYIREMNVTTLEDGIRRITSLPAEFIGIKDRGIIKEGKYADITIFDQSRIAGKATYEKPSIYPEGIEYVIVNGKVQLEKETFNKLPCGRILRIND